MMPSDFLFPSTNSRKTPKYSRSNYLKQSQKSQSFSLKFLNQCFCFVFLVKSLKQLKRKLSVDRLISKLTNRFTTSPYKIDSVNTCDFNVVTDVNAALSYDRLKTKFEPYLHISDGELKHLLVAHRAD